MKTTTITALLLLTATPLVAQDFHRWRVLVQQKNGWTFLEDAQNGTTMVDRQMTLIDAAQELYSTRKIQVLETTDSRGADIIYFDMQVSCLHKTYMITEARGYDVLDRHVYTEDDLRRVGFRPIPELEHEWFCNLIAGEP
jgi:hypothetical protein